MKKTIIQFAKQPLIYVVLISIVFSNIIYYIIPSNMTFYDSESYTNAAETVNILEGKVDSIRTPIYPLFIKLVKCIGGEENLQNNIAFAQKCLFVITLILFYYCLKQITNNKNILFIVPIIFGIAPCIITWNAAILTESIALLEMVILSFLTLKILKKPSSIIASLIGFTILIMILTRPIFLYILPIYMLFWILRYFYEKKKQTEHMARYTVIGFISCIICIIILLVYCMLVENQYGEFKLTTVSEVNSIMSCVYSKSYKESNNYEIITMIDEIKESGKTVLYGDLAQIIENKFGEPEIKEFIKSSQKSERYIKYLLSKVLSIASQNIGTNYTEKYILSYIDSILIPISFGAIYIVLAISIVYLCNNLIKNKKIDWILAFCISLIAGNLLTIIIGSPFEEQRLFLPSIILVLILATYLVEKLLQNIKGER